MAIAAALLIFTTLLAAISAFGYAKYVKPSRLIDRLAFEARPGIALAPETPKESWWGMLAGSVGNLLPVSPADRKRLTREMETAGIRSEKAIAIFMGARLMGAVSLFVLMFFVRDYLTSAPIFRIVLLLAGGAGGYAAPGFILARMIKSRQEQIRFALPDALDLLVICTEAGCGLDQALLTVSQELQLAHPAICEELNIVNLEVLAGKTRPDALRNFAGRTGEEEVKKLVAVLVQTDRFGTSVADALRAQSEFMRIRRRQEAEERAGKIGVKLVFPIFFFCMPSLFIVAAGPGMMTLFRTLPALRNVH